jgi:Glyoxalase-like domain
MTTTMIRVSDDAAIGWVREIVLDCAEPWALARFWAGLLGGSPVEWYPGWVTIEPPPRGQRLSFQASTTLPGAGPAAVHFDVLVDDLSTAHDRVLAAGAVFADEHVSPRPGPAGEPVRWRVYRDPAGHPFCLVVR